MVRAHRVGQLKSAVIGQIDQIAGRGEDIDFRTLNRPLIFIENLVLVTGHESALPPR
jgi:hypothetical protein